MCTIRTCDGLTSTSKQMNTNCHEYIHVCARTNVHTQTHAHMHTPVQPPAHTALPPYLKHSKCMQLTMSTEAHTYVCTHIHRCRRCYSFHAIPTLEGSLGSSWCSCLSCSNWRRALASIVTPGGGCRNAARVGRDAFRTKSVNQSIRLTNLYSSAGLALSSPVAMLSLDSLNVRYKCEQPFYWYCARKCIGIFI